MENTIDTNYDEVYDYFGDELTENDDRFENYRKTLQQRLHIWSVLPTKYSRKETDLNQKNI